MWFAGIDGVMGPTSITMSRCWMAMATKSQVATARVAHTVAGLAQLSALLRGLVAPDGQFEDVVCLVETTQGLLITALLEAGLSVYPVNPKRVDGVRPPLRPQGVKTDAFDALLLAHKGRELLAEPADAASRYAIAAGAQGPPPRPDEPACRANAAGEPTDGLPHGVLPRRVDVF